MIIMIWSRFNSNLNNNSRRCSWKTVVRTIMPDIKTFVFLDLETTGLPYLENNKTKITEMCLVAVQADHLRLGVFPRIQNKLSLCFNPGRLISDGAEKLTGLSNFLLENSHHFSSATVKYINTFIDHIPKPVCFVAHNGNRFDYPILRKEIISTGTDVSNDIYCIDSLEMFKDIDKTDNLPDNKSVDLPDSVPFEFTDDFDQLLCNAVDEYENSQKVLKAQKMNETTPEKQIIESTLCNPAKKLKLVHEISQENMEVLQTDTDNQTMGSTLNNPCNHLKSTPSRRTLNYGLSFKLGDVYQRFMQSKPEHAHMAEGDVNMLITCAAKLGDKFVDWSNEHAKKFCEIPPMEAGKRIGT